MTERQHPIAWVVWAVVAAITVASTRNPLYLTISATAIFIVYTSLPRSRTTSRAWTTAIWIGLVVSGFGIALNVLTVHVGDRVLVSVPDDVPIAGGPITLNALVYGIVTALALLAMLLIATTFALAVDRGALLRLVPRSLSAAGVSAIVGLSFFPQTLAALGEVRQSQQARGFEVRRARDLAALLIPALHIGLERAVDLAEAMESRGYGATVTADRWSRLLLLIGLTGSIATITLLAVSRDDKPLTLAIPSVAAIALGVWRQGKRSAARYRSHRYSRIDGFVIASSICALTLLAVSFLDSAKPLSWSPYPILTWPSFAVTPGAASGLLVVPAIPTLFGEPE